MARKSSKNNYLKQAGILAAAGIICRIIGILYRSPLTSIIGDEGNGYYTSAYNIYTTYYCYLHIVSHLRCRRSLHRS